MKKNYSERYPKVNWVAKYELADSGLIESKIYRAPHASKVGYNLKKRMDIKKIISILPQHTPTHTHHPHLLSRNAHEEV